MRLNVKDIVGFEDTKTVASFGVTKLTLSAPVAFAKPVQNDTFFTFGMFFNMTNVSNIEFVVGTAPYPDNGWQSIAGPTNLTGTNGEFTLQNFTELIKFVDYNYNIYYDNNETFALSSTTLLNGSSVIIKSNSIALKNFASTYKYNCTGAVFDSSCSIITNDTNNLYGTTDIILFNSSPMTLGSTLAPLTNIPNIKYFDTNNNSRYDNGEPVFNSTDNVITNISELAIPSSAPALTLHLNTSLVQDLTYNLTNDNSYRITVRYWNGSDVSPWASTNPIIYKVGYNVTEYKGPEAVYVYDKNTTHSEPGSIVDIAHSSNLSFYWTTSVPQRPEIGEYILRYEYAFGNEPWPYDGWNSLSGWVSTADNSTTNISINATLQQKLVQGEMYYLTVRALSSFGLYSANSSTNGIVYNDKTAPLITVINVAGNTTPGRVSTIVQPLTATIYSPLENLSQCGYSLFKTPFDINYVITRRCNVVDPNNQTYITCDLKDMSGNDLAKGNYTFYFACLDKNFNSNQVVGTNPTIALNLTYTYPEAPTVTNLDVKGNNSRYGQMYNEVYRDTILNCYNLTYYDPDNDPISITEYNWQKNGVDLPAYENSTTLNISKYTPFIGANYSCSVRLMDSTNRWSAQYTSENITVINSPPSAVTLLTPANGTYVTTTTTFSWNYGYDIDPDLLNYTLMIMNYTDSFMYNMIANYSTRNETNFYTFDLTQNYADGLYFWKIKTCDNTTYRNNCTNSSQIFNFVKDSTGPLINILTPDNMSTVGLEFEIAANVFDRDPSTHLYNEPTSVRVRLWNGTELVNTTMTKSNGLYRFSVDGNSLNLTDKSYNITVYASDSLGNWANQTINISINPNKPILQIDWPPWEFREQYLNHNFNLNLSAKNAAMINYTIYNATHIIKANNTVFVQLGMLIDQPEFVYKEPVDVSNLSDGKYFINFTAVDSLGNKEFKQSWFVIDKTAPMNYSVYYDTVLYSGASEAVTFEWANNSLVPDDNMYGVKNVTLYLVATSTLTNSIFKDASSAVYTATPVIEFIDAIITTSNTKQNYTFTIPSQYVSLNAKYLYFVTCAVDYAGNNKCTQQFNLTVGNRVPVVTGLINDIIIYEIDGYNNTINLSQNLKDPDNEQVNYTGILLPKGVLLYDPLDDVRKTRALQGNTSGTLTWKDNVIYRNATLVEIAHYNLLGDGGFENYTLYNDSNGIIRLASSSKWTLVNNASTSNISGQYYNGLYGARVSGENYFYQKVIVQQSTNYTLSQYMKSESGNINGRLHINWYDSSGNYISSTLNLSDNTSRPQLDTTWKRYNITVKSPANAWQAWIYADTDSNESYAYVDNILFEESNYITAYSPFDHATGYLRYPKQPTYNGNSSIRQNINASAGTLEVSIMPTWDGTDARERYLFDASGQAKFYANINQSINMTLLNFVYGSYNVSYNISGWKDGGIYRLAFLWDNNTIAIYVNGTNYRQMALGGYKLVNSNLSNNIYIGSRNDSTKQIDAFLDELIIYDYFKSTSEIEQDNNTIPVGKLDNYDSTNYNLILFNMSINNVASASNFSIPNITIDPDKYKPSSTYHQRVQFFAEDVADYIASNVVDIHVISDNNFYGTNVTLFNSSICTGGAPVCNDIGYNLSNMSDASDADGAANNITSSFIYNSILENTTAGTFGIGSSTLNFTLVNSSFVSGTTAYMSVINYSNVSGISTFTNSNISNSIVINSTLINSSIANHSIVVNSLILNSILENVNLSNAVIDPTIIVRVSGVNFTINDSNTLMDVKVNHSTIVNATSILNSNITYCKISTVENHGVRSNYNISDALLQGDRNNTDLCRLLNGSLTVIQNTTTDGVIYNTATYPFIFYTATHTAQPLIKDIWNYTPIVTLVSATGSPLTNYSSITFPYLTFNVSIVDPNINSTIMDYVNVTWDVWGTDKDGYPIHLLDKTITNLNQTNISDANNKTSKNETITNINISIIVTDRFGNKVSQSLKGLNYSYAVALPPATVYLNCSLNGTNVTHGQSATFYSVTNSTSCSSSGLSRTCNNGTLSGSNLYNYSSCTTITDPGSGGGGGGGGKSYCYNGKRDFTKGETGIDCGGICGSCYKLCNDSKLNGQESQTDCGGVCKSCPVPPISGGATTSLTCYNGKKDSNEEDVDCGGACKKSCAVPTPTPTSTATCVDGVQNQGEWAVDCGGPCPACQQQQQPVDLPEPTFANWIPWFILIFVVLFALIVLWIIIVSDKNKYKRIEEHERTIEKKLEHEEELIASMGANLGDRINASIANISNASQQISAVSNGQNIAGMTTAGLYAQQDAESRGPISDSIINLEKYIIACLDAGFMPSKIRQSLDTVSWSPVVVDVVIHKIMLSGDKLEEVEKYISKQIRKGMTDEQIAEKLASEHWSKEIVDLIISDVHKITHNNQNLKSYVEKKLKEGKTLDEIHQILVSIGWNERYIQKIFNKHFDNKRS
jgi:hypothetical protein